MSMKLMCGVKKGRVFIGSQSSHQAAHHSASVRSQRSPQSWRGQTETDTHTESQVKGEGQRSFLHPPPQRRLLLMSLVNSEWCLSSAHEAQIHIDSTSPPDQRINTLYNHTEKHFISTVMAVKKNDFRRQIHSKQLIQGKLCICRQYGQCKGNNMNFHHRTGNFQAWHEVFL